MKNTLKTIATHLLTSLLSLALFVSFTQTQITPQEKTPAQTDNVSTQNNDMTLQEVAEKVIPSIVTIQVSGLASVEVTGEGSGIILSETGLIATNAHVVDEGQNIKVIDYQGSTYKASVIGLDKNTDLALLKIAAKDLTPATLGDSDSLKVADQVMAIGNPGGLKFSSSVTIGYVSALNRPTKAQQYHVMNSIQTDAAINPGNSGGALVNTKGEVIGINSSKIVKEGFEGLGFAIPINTAKPILESLKEYGYVKDRATIGISYQFLDKTSAQFYDLPVGMYVHQTTTENAAKVLKEGDIIIEVEGQQITDPAVVTSLLNSKKPEDVLEMKVYRDSKEISVKIQLSENSQ